MHPWCRSALLSGTAAAILSAACNPSAQNLEVAEEILAAACSLLAQHPAVSESLSSYPRVVTVATLLHSSYLHVAGGNQSCCCYHWGGTCITMLAFLVVNTIFWTCFILMVWRRKSSDAHSYHYPIKLGADSLATLPHQLHLVPFFFMFASYFSLPSVNPAALVCYISCYLHILVPCFHSSNYLRLCGHDWNQLHHPLSISPY